MDVRSYLPSSQFALIVSALLASGGLVLAATYVTRIVPAPHNAESSLASTQDSTNWLESLREIQAQSGVTLPTPPDPNTVEKLLNAAQSSNITDTVARTLFINLSNAKTQGLGDDIPTQDKLIADATAQVEKDRGTPTYSLSDLTTTGATQAELHAYGNTAMLVLKRHPKANVTDTLIAIGYATDNQDASQLADLAGIGAEYKLLAQDLAAVQVPQTFAPLHLQIINNFMRISDTYEDMATLLSDPLRGLGGLQLYQSLIGENKRLLTNIAELLSKNAILFTKDEPGSTWGSLLTQ